MRRRCNTPHNLSVQSRCKSLVSVRAETDTQYGRAMLVGIHKLGLICAFDNLVEINVLVP